MAITKTQSVTGNGATLTLNGVAANALLTLNDAYIRSPGTGATESAPTDTQGTWSVANSDVPPQLTGDDVGVGAFYQANVASGTHTVTPQALTFHEAVLVEWAGAATSLPFDLGTSAKSTAANHTSQATGTTGVTAQANEMVLISCVYNSTTGGANVGWTDPVSGFTTLFKIVDDTTDLPTMPSFKNVSATGTQTATFNWTDSQAVQASMANIATFKAAASADIGVGSGVFHGDGPGMGPRLRRMMPQQFATPGPVDTVTPAPQIQPLRGPGFGPRLRRMMPQQFAIPGAAIVGGKVGAWTWLGLASALSTILAAKVGAYTWKGDTSPLSTEIVAKVGAWTWAGDRSPLSAEIVARTGAYTWSGIASPLSAEIRSALGSYTWAGLRSPLSSEIVTRVGAYAWSGSSATFGSAIQAKIGAYTWSGTQSPPAVFLNAAIGNYSWTGIGSSLASTASQVTPGKLPPWPWTWTHDQKPSQQQKTVDYSRDIERAMLREQRLRAERRRLEQELRAKAAQKPSPKASAPERAQQISLQNRDYAILRRKIKAAEAEHAAAVTREIELRLKALENEQTVSETVAARRQRELMMVLLLA